MNIINIWILLESLTISGGYSNTYLESNTYPWDSYNGRNGNNNVASYSECEGKVA